MTDEPVSTLRRIATLTAAGLFLLTVVPAISVAPDVPQVAPTAQAQLIIDPGATLDDCLKNGVESCSGVSPPSTDPCDHVDCTTHPCDFVDCNPDPGQECQKVYNKLDKALAELPVYVTSSVSECIPSAPSTNPCDYGNSCYYEAVLQETLNNWSATRDGYPHPTLDCATGPTIPWIDTDGDGTIDPLDDDDDCDHVSDDLERDLGMKRLERDSDDDGVFDRRDLTPTVNRDVWIVVRAVELELLNWETGPTDAFAPDDPYLTAKTGVTHDQGDPSEDQSLVIPNMTESDHLHNAGDQIYDYTSYAKEGRQGLVKFPQELSYSEYEKLSANGYPQLELFADLGDHDDDCESSWEAHDDPIETVDDELGLSISVGDSVPYYVCPDGHPKGHESTAENEHWFRDQPVWTLLQLSRATGQAMSVDELASASLSNHTFTIHHDNGDWKVDFVIEPATNTSPCGVINAVLGLQEGSGSDDYVTVKEFLDEEGSTGYNCSNV